MEKLKEKWKAVKKYMRYMRKKKKAYWIGCIICVVTFVLLLALLIGLLVSNGRQEEAEDVYSQLRGQKDTNIENGSSDDDNPLHRKNTIDFENLICNDYPDMFAWIEIPGTQVDYPMVQHATDDTYYLNHTIEGKSGLPGSIYTESIHPIDMSATHTVVYGHNMINKTMFGSLHDYEEKGKIEENPYIYIYMPGETHLYQIFSAVGFSDTYLPNYLDYDNEEDFNQFIDELKASNGHFNEDVEVEYGDKILTLSTCIRNHDNLRYLVTAVLIDEY
ncbi:MAG: class B sortase [Lachnospiraceae bacterium]|nr:class B sortase [Lachnospiraceae bacterium]